MNDLWRRWGLTVDSMKMEKLIILYFLVKMVWQKLSKVIIIIYFFSILLKRKLTKYWKKKIFYTHCRGRLPVSRSQCIGNFQILDEIFSDFWKVSWFGAFLSCGREEVIKFLDFTDQRHFHLKYWFVEVEELWGSCSFFNHHFLQVGTLLFFQCFANVVCNLNDDQLREN